MATSAAKQHRRKHTAPNEEARLRALFGLAPEPPPTPYRYNPRNFVHNLQPTGKLTKQGVRDLNGPRQDGTGYNGNRGATCAHHKTPDLTPTHNVSRMVKDAEELSGMRRAVFVCCSLCGVELGEE